MAHHDSLASSTFRDHRNFWGYEGESIGVRNMPIHLQKLSTCQFIDRDFKRRVYSPPEPVKPFKDYF
ncbi:hypothetical protein DMB83_002585 [Pectobacterium aquaticum]|nr:hypothetical protein DMB83_002585 [Pectobacterium aquaticum]